MVGGYHIMINTMNTMKEKYYDQAVADRVRIMV